MLRSLSILLFVVTSGPLDANPLGANPVRSGIGARPAETEPTRSPTRRALALDIQRETALGLILTSGEASTTPPGDLAEAMLALGPNHLPELFSVLLDGRLRMADELGEREVRLSPRLASPVRLAIAGQPRSALTSFLETLARRRPTAAEQRVALGMLGALGERQDLSLLVKLAEPPKSTPRVARDVCEAFEAALSGLSSRHTLTAPQLADVFLEAHPSFSAPLIDAFGGCEPSAALPELTSLLGRVPEADALLLVALGNAGAQLPAPVDPSVTSRTRNYLGSARPELVVEAVVTAGKLRDVGAMPELVRLMRDPLVAPRATQVLRALSGQRYSSADSWEAWYSMERAWLERVAPERLARLSSGTPAQIAEVLMELARKPCFRDQLAPAVLEVLERPEKDLVLMACAVLGHLRSAVGERELEALSEHADAGIRAAATGALTSIRTPPLAPAKRSVATR